MVSARTRLEIATENLANVSTDGFRRIVAKGSLTPFGVTIASVRANDRGGLRHTGRDFDLAIVGNGGFRVRGSDGRLAITRDGAFERESDGTLRDPQGRTLLGAEGPLKLPQGAAIDACGRVIVGGRIVDRLALPPESRVQSGFLESAAVDAITEMVDVLAAERSFESAEKIVSAIDQTSRKSASDVARVK